MYHQDSLFYNESQTPLADRVRPKNLDEYIGQTHLVGKDKILRKLIENDQMTSMIFLDHQE